MKFCIVVRNKRIIHVSCFFWQKIFRVLYAPRRLRLVAWVKKVVFLILIILLHFLMMWRNYMNCVLINKRFAYFLLYWERTVLKLLNTLLHRSFSWLLHGFSPDSTQRQLRIAANSKLCQITRDRQFISTTKASRQGSSW